jgi:hypothetical protein
LPLFFVAGTALAVLSTLWTGTTTVSAVRARSTILSWRTLDIALGLFDQHLAREAQLALVINAQKLDLDLVAFLVEGRGVFDALPIHF